VREFRSMVKSLHEQGLRVVMDVVYNHTSGSQQGPLSVLDKIVPTYYYRLNNSGNITGDSCCADTAAENAMMAKLMIDSVVTWARDYQVDSFRFDIMGMAPLSVLTRLKAEVDQAAGRDIYLYGEAWNFGVIANDARFVQARQANMFGTGIGSFNDRLRDAVRGGGCCDGGEALISQQGFINGVFTDPNATSTQTKDDLLRLGDLVKVGLSGTLRDYSFTDRFGALRKNSDIDYFGQRAGFAASPQETINYVEAHDNQTLFDLNAYKLPQSTSRADRLRVQNLGAAINMLSQGVPFFHAGQEILRSKSMDRDSYNAGDWFNKLDYSYLSNNFGVGLPMEGVNGGNWPLISPILANPLIAPDSAAIVSARDYFIDLLKIRSDTSLFRLRTAQDVIDRVKFHNTGPQQVAGVIAMTIDGSGYQHAKYKTVATFINVDKVARDVTVTDLRNRILSIHKVQRNSNNDQLAKTATYNRNSGTFRIPPRTTVVFVETANVPM
jgi:pullulanase